MFAEDKIDWSEKWVAQGREEGLEKGRAEGREEGQAVGLAVTREMLVESVLVRFGGPLAARVSAWLEKIGDVQTLREVGKWLLACKSPETLMDRMQSA